MTEDKTTMEFRAPCPSEPDQSRNKLLSDLSGSYKVALHTRIGRGARLRGDIYLVVHSGGSADVFQPGEYYEVTIRPCGNS